MPRSIPTTTWTERTSPTTNWSSRDISDIVWDAADFSWIETDYTWDWTLNTTYRDTPRYESYLEDLTKDNVDDLTWDPVIWISGLNANKIDTTWSIRDISDIVWDWAGFSWIETDYTWDTTLNTTFWDTPRYEAYLEDLTWDNVDDLTWSPVTWVSGIDANKIDTVWI